MIIGLLLVKYLKNYSRTILEELIPFGYKNVYEMLKNLVVRLGYFLDERVVATGYANDVSAFSPLV